MSYELGSALRLRDGVEVVAKVIWIGLEGRRQVILHLDDGDGGQGIRTLVPEMWSVELERYFEEVAR